MWGSSFLFIKVAGEDFPPAYVALGRVALGGLTLHLLVLAARERLPRDARMWAQLALLAVFWNTIPFICFAWGEQRASSVLAGIWNATTPLWTILLLAVALRAERPTRLQVQGLLLGFAGVVLVLAPWEGLGGASVAGQAAFFVAASCYAIGMIVARRKLTGREDSGLVLATGQMTMATLQLAVIAPLTGIPDGPFGAEAIASLAALGALGTGVAYAMFFGIVRASGAATSSSVTYLVVVFSTLLGLIVLGERVDWHEPVGAAVIVAALGISQGHARLLRRSPGSQRARNARRASRATGR